MLLLVLAALEQVRAGNALPPLGSTEFAASVRAAALAINEARPADARVDGVDKVAYCATASSVGSHSLLPRVGQAGALIDAIALTAGAVLNPMAALFGGIVGQEARRRSPPPPARVRSLHNARFAQVVKAASGKFHPIHQWLMFESLESAPARSASAADHLPADKSEVRARCITNASLLTTTTLHCSNATHIRSPLSVAPCTNSSPSSASSWLAPVSAAVVVFVAPPSPHRDVQARSAASFSRTLP